MAVVLQRGGRFVANDREEAMEMIKNACVSLPFYEALKKVVAKIRRLFASFTTPLISKNSLKK